MRALSLAALFVASASSAALAQPASCAVGPSAPYQQSALQPVPLPPQLPTTPAHLLPQLPQAPPFKAPPSNPVGLSPSGTGGTQPQSPGGTGGSLPPNAPSTPATPGGPSGLPASLDTSATTLKQIMNETFSGSQIDDATWGYNYPWSNTCDTNGNTDATQYAAYVSPKCDAQKSAGVFSTGANGLDIAIKPTPGGVDAAGKSYVSGQLYSRQAFYPGTYIETTAKLPTGSGLGGAFWLIPQSGAWPPEIDVMESQGENPNSVTQTIHDRMPDGSVSNQQVVANVPGSQSGFHTYGADFEKDRITFYTDGKATGSFATPASFQQGMYAILSTNASPPGSQNWHGTVAPGTPATDYQVQSVRAYCLNNCN